MTEEKPVIAIYKTADNRYQINHDDIHPRQAEEILTMCLKTLTQRVTVEEAMGQMVKYVQDIMTESMGKPMVKPLVRSTGEPLI